MTSYATGTVTTNYSFKTLDDGDIAGNDGINEVITSIDTNTSGGLSVANMVTLYFGSIAPLGWTNINSTIVNLQATASFTGYIWIKKN